MCVTSQQEQTIVFPFHEIDNLLISYMRNSNVLFIVVEVENTSYSRNLKEWFQEQLESNPPICVSEDVKKLQYFLQLCEWTEREV